MKILITGATGLIGKELGKKLVEAGHAIHALSRHPDRAQMDLPFPAKIFKWESGHSEFPRAALDGVEAVINLAGEPIADKRWTPEQKARIRDSRILGTRHLIEAISVSSTKPKVFLQGSAIGYYGNRGDEILTESSEIGKGFLAEVVRDWEAEAEKVSAFGTRLVLVRTAVVFSAHGGALERLFPVFEKGLGGQLGNGQQWMSWIHLDDLVRTFIFALENPSLSGVVNGSAPEPARNDRFTHALCRAIGRSEFLPVPTIALKLALGETATAILESQRVKPEKLQQAGFEYRFPELVPALQNVAEAHRDGEHELLTEQWVPRQVDEIFPYFCDEKNLEALTPPFLNFRVLKKSTHSIEHGTEIDYRLSLHGVPFSWRTRIEEWTPGIRFVDLQLKGPYAKWHHTHDFVPFAGGTLLRDRVRYKMPLGRIGDALSGWKVHRDVNQIFSFRRKKIHELFGEKR